VRVLYFSQDYTPHDFRFLSALSKTEHDIFYLPLERVKSTESRELPEGVQMAHGWGRTKSMRAFDVPFLRRKLRKLLEEIRPDVVHAGPVQKSAFLTALAGYQPLVTMSWGSDLLMDAQRGVGRCAARYALSKSAILVCDCNAVRDVAVNLGMPEDRVVIFPWGVDLNHFNPDRSADVRKVLGWENDFVLISTRAWEPLYGLDVLIDGFIEAARSEANLRLLLLSKGSLELVIRSKLESAGMLDRVHFAGQVGYDDLPDYYRSADLYISASYSDGSSISLLEAMACGVPALVSDIPGNREWITPGKAGWWFIKGDPKSLSEGILMSRRNRKALNDMAGTARHITEKRANWQENFASLLYAYSLAVAQV
jgi:glycosyltransferase involved in cell wall biosynthesis